MKSGFCYFVDAGGIFYYEVEGTPRTNHVGATIVSRETPAPYYPLWLHDMPLTSGEVPRYEAERVVPANTPLYPSSTIPLFREKDGTKKPPSGRSPPKALCPPSDVLVTRAAVYDFLPLRLCDEMGTGGCISHTSRPHAIGHRCMESFVYLVDVSYGFLQHRRGDSRIVPKRSPLAIPTATNEQTSPNHSSSPFIIYHLSFIIPFLLPTK